MHAITTTAGRTFRCAVPAAAVLASPALLSAHELTGHAAREWELDPLVVVPLILTLACYAAGLARVWRRAGVGHGISMWAAAAFGAGWTTLAIALVSPIAWLSRILFSVHMAQHTLLMLVAAPLLAFGHPLLAWMWALDDRTRDRVAHAFRGRRTVAAWRGVTTPLVVFLLQAAALWIWHIPSWYEGALHNDGIHAVQHFSFVMAGSLFWRAMTHGRYGRSGYGLAVLYVFMTAVHSGGLGALLTFAPGVWYSEYAKQAAAWRVDALADQQLAGLLMWIPAGVVFIVLGLALTAAWLGEAERRVRYSVTDAASRTVPMLVLLCALAASACGGQSAVVREAETLTGGSVERGRSAIGKYGCAACHTIPGIADAQATVGPPLSNIAVRGYLGGHLPNSPANMMKWIQHPQQVDPKNVMPELGVTDQDARDITAYLYTLR